MEGVEKRLLIFVSLFLFTIMFTGFSEAAVTCSDPNQVILRLSSSTNAHGEVFADPGLYTEDICYDTIFGVSGDGNRVCSGSNKVVGLSGTTNAHAENPGLSSYGTEVCYGDLSCTARTGACLVGESLVLTLSSATNAHLSSGSDYSQNICCSIGPVHSECVNNACTVVPGAGDDTCAEIGASCDPDVEEHAVCTNNMCVVASGPGTNECDVMGESCDVGICGDGNIDTGEQCDDGNTDNGDGCSSTCQDEVHSECVNNACTVVPGAGDDTCAIIDDVDSCGIIDPGHSICDNQMCEIASGPGTNECSSDSDCVAGSCSITSASWSRSGEVIERTIVDMIVNGTDCGGVDIDFEIYENDPFFDDLVTTINGNFDTLESWATIWKYDGDDDLGEDPRDYYFKAIVSGTSESEQSSTLAVSELPVTYCDFVVLCGSYYTLGDITAENTCNVDTCNKADFSVETKQEEVGFCDDEDIFCFCEWNTSGGVCQSAWEVESPPSPPGEAGKCVYTETTTGSCEDGGFLISSWTAIWTGLSTNAACVSDSRVIECPAQIQLSFFNLYNMLITLLAIAGIYGILSLRKKSLFE